MNKTNLISSLAGLGLILTNSSCEKKELISTNEESQNTIMKSPVQNLGYTPLYSVEIPQEIQEQIIALANLTNDVFRDPSVAEAFSNNPNNYLTSIGLSSCNLDLNSVEVKAILALGDKEIRQAIVDYDLPKYVRLLHEKNYLNWNTDHYDFVYQNFLDQCFANVPELEKLGVYLPIVSCYVIYPFSFIVPIQVFGSNIVINRILANPVINIWGLENNPNDNIYIVNEMVEQQVNQIIEAMKVIAKYQNREIEVTDDVLRAYLRKPVTQQLIDFNLI